MGTGATRQIFVVDTKMRLDTPYRWYRPRRSDSVGILGAGLYLLARSSLPREDAER